MVSLPDATIRTGTLTFSMKATELMARMELEVADTQPKVGGSQGKARGSLDGLAGALEAQAVGGQLVAIEKLSLRRIGAPARDVAVSEAQEGRYLGHGGDGRILVFVAGERDHGGGQDDPVPPAGFGLGQAQHDMPAHRMGEATYGGWQSGSTISDMKWARSAS